MRSLVLVPLVAIAIASAATAHAQPPKPATGSTGSTGSTGAAKPATGSTQPARPATGSTQPARPATGPTGSTGTTQPARPATGAQTPTPPAAPATPPAAPATPSAPGRGQPGKAAPLPPPSSDAYTYQTEGRRDPFINLVTTNSTETRALGDKKLGPAGMTVAEISVRGVVQSKGTLLAMILGSDNKTYIVHQGDKFFDGTIKQITPQGLVITQEVNDPLSLVKQREVRKLLRSLEDAKE